MSGARGKQAGEVSLVDLLRTLNHYRLLILGGVLLGLGGALAGLALVKPVYLARALVLIEPGEPQTRDEAVSAAGLSTDDSVIDSQARILASRSLAEEVVTSLGLVGDAELGGSVERRAVLDSFLDRLDVARDGKSNVIYIAFRSHDADQAARVANEIASRYITGLLSTKHETTRRGTEWLSSQIEETRRKLDEAEAALAAYRSQSRARFADVVQLPGLDIANLKRDHITALADRAAREAQLRRIRELVEEGTGAVAFEELGGSVVLQNLHALKNQAIRREAELAAQFGARHPLILDVKSELAELEQQIAIEQHALVGRVRSELDQARARENALAHELDTIKSQSLARSEIENRTAELERGVDLNRRLYEGYLARLQAVSDIQHVQRADARIISPAVAPQLPASPKPRLVLGTSLVASLATALMIIYLLEQGDRGFRTGRALEETLGMPCLGLVPAVSKRKADGAPPHDYVLDRVRSRLAETMRGLLASLDLSQTRERARVLMITSALPEEGKSTLALSLARTAAGEGLRVLLIDADLRRPRLHAMLGHETRAGLPEVLRGEAELDDVLLDDPRCALQLLPASRRQDQPTRLLGVDGLGALVERLRPGLDLIVIDSAPLMAVSDARLLARIADDVLLVCRWNKTPRALAAHAAAQLRDAGARIAGSVLGRVDLERHARQGLGEAAIASRQLRAYYMD